MKRAKLKKVAIYTVSVLAGLTLLTGFLHTKAGRPLLARLGLRCPVKASPEAVEAARRNAARTLRGTETAASRPALGFALDSMTLTDVKAWATQKNVSCDELRVGLMRCTDVPSLAVGSTGPVINRLDFGFAPATEHLVNVSAWRSGMTGDAAAAQLSAVVRKMKEQLGAPTHEAGSRTAGYLASGPMHTATVEYRFKDYIADVSATNIPGRGLLMREHYMSARD
ncbi:MAG TPA: hypothetical protein VF294_07490 [Polyangiaceae bacterium]